VHAGREQLRRVRVSQIVETASSWTRSTPCSQGTRKRARIIGLVNAGYRRGVAIPRVIDGSKDARPPKLFKIFSPKMFAGIGTVLPPATLSQTATLRLKKKKSGEDAERLRLRVIKSEAAALREAFAA
jgi:hypothetical protein